MKNGYVLENDYISGKAFLSTYAFKVEPQKVIPNRMEYVESVVQGKKILHIGCASHLPNIPDEIHSGKWFHNLLTEASLECVGIDINQEAIDLLVSKYNVKNVYYGNVESNEKIPSIVSNHWDYAIFAEVLEHIDNPVFFLKKFVSTYKEHVSKIIITVPNCYQFRNIKALFSNEELINSDHRYWFSPYTILKVIYQAGLDLEELKMCKNYTTEEVRGGSLKDSFLKRYPIMAQNIVLVASTS